MDKSDKNEDDFEKSVKGLTTAIEEKLGEEHMANLEPFEAYAHRVRSQVLLGLGEFRERFQEGYKVLLEELKKTD